MLKRIQLPFSTTSKISGERKKEDCADRQHLASHEAVPRQPLEHREAASENRRNNVRLKIGSDIYAL